MTRPAVRLFRWLSWLPLVTFLGTRIYVGRYEGWGAWAAGPLLLLPIGLSALMAVVGLRLCYGAARRDAIDVGTILATLLAAIPLIWFAVRAILSP